MKKYRHKLSPQDHKNIVEQAKLLPKLVRVGKNGKTLERATVTFKNVTDFNAEKGTFTKHIERSSEPVYVNHEVEMVSAFWDGGAAGVHKYIQSVKDTDARARAEEVENIEPRTTAELEEASKNAVLKGGSGA